MLRKAFFFFCLALWGAPVLAGEVMIQSCSDGDTCTLQVAGLSFKARLVGIDAPEVAHRGTSGQPFGEEAKTFLNQRAAGRSLQVQQYGIDAYNRPLVNLKTSDGLSVNEELVKSGLAEVYEGKTRYDVTALKNLQSQAKSQKKGMWAQGDKYVSPYIYRKRIRSED